MNFLSIQEKVISLHLQKRKYHEENISAIEQEAQKQTRIPRKDVDQERPQGIGQQKSEGKEKADCF